jgi:pantoate--beta-alanine ligase
VTTFQSGAARIVRTIEELRSIAAATRAAGGTVGFFGTNGNLHDGHLTIIRRMVSECDFTVLPLHEGSLKPIPGLLEFDLDSGFERDIDSDRAMAAAAGVDVVFVATPEELYQHLPVRIHVVPDESLASPWENAEHPAFMRMTATAITKYWNIIGRCRYYLGEKDWVPLAVLRNVVDSLSIPVELVSCPVVRMDDGLCASSRNRKLSAGDRAAAPTLYKSLQEAANLIDSGERGVEPVRALLRERIEKVAKLDYAEVVDAYTLKRVDPLRGELRIVVGADFNGIHLFDNIGVVVLDDSPTVGTSK